MGRAWSAPLRSGRRGRLVVIIGAFIFATLPVAGANPIHPVLVLVSPDLQPVNPAIRPFPGYEGDTIDVAVTVVNVGEADALSATIALIDSHPNGEPVSIGPAVLSGPLAPGASAIVRLPPFLAAGVGEHKLTITVGNVTPAEANVNNDAIAMWMPVLQATSPPPPPPSGTVGLEVLATLGFGAALGFIFVVAVIAVVIVALSRREPDTAGPPPPEPRDRSPPPIWPP